MLLTEDHEEPEPLYVDRQEHRPILSSHQKTWKALAVLGRITGIVSEVPMPKFPKRMEIFEALLHHWMDDDDVRLSINMRETAAEDCKDAHACSVSREPPCLRSPDVTKMSSNSGGIPCTLALAKVAHDSPCIRPPRVNRTVKRK